MENMAKQLKLCYEALLALCDLIRVFGYHANSQ
jgi:hypothetical protein